MIIAALKTLDPQNPEHWTADGLPRTEALNLPNVKRADIVRAAPHFTRANPVLTTPAAIKAIEDAPKEPTVADRHEAAKLAVYNTNTVLRAAIAAHDRAVADLDRVEREIQAANGARSGQQDIMDYLAAQQIKRDRIVERMQG